MSSDSILFWSPLKVSEAASGDALAHAVLESELATSLVSTVEDCVFLDMNAGRFVKKNNESSPDSLTHHSHTPRRLPGHLSLPPFF